MKKLMTRHSAVKIWNSSKEEGFKNGEVKGTKKAALKKIEEYLAAKGMGMDILSESEYVIMNYLVHNTCVTGLQSIGNMVMEKRTGYCEVTLCRAKKKLKQLGLFEVGYLGKGHKGVCVYAFKLHENYESIMKEIFGVEVVKPAPEEEDVRSNVSSDVRSSNSEIPWESKAEEPKKVSTTYTTYSLKQEKNNYKHYDEFHSFVGKENERANVYMSENQIDMFHTIKASNWDKLIKDHADVIVLRAGIDMDSSCVLNALSALDQGIGLGEDLDSIPALFEYYYKKRLKKKKESVKKVVQEQSYNNVPFYNWLES